MTITLTLPVLWGLIVALLSGYLWIGIVSEENAGINPVLAITIVAIMQVVLFLIVYGFMTLMGL